MFGLINEPIVTQLVYVDLYITLTNTTVTMTLVVHQDYLSFLL